jgi:prevent-host-death family protein
VNLPQKKVRATEIKNRLGDYLGEVIRKKEPLLIEKHGKPAAVVVSADEWRDLEKRGRIRKSTPWIEELRALNEKIARNHPDAKPFSAADLIRQIRDEEF